MKDTAFPVLSEDITLSNLIFNDLEACNELADSLQSRIKSDEKAIDDCINLSNEKDEQIANLLNQAKLIDEMLKTCDEVQKKKDRKVKFLKFTRNIAICVAGLEAAYIGLKLVFEK